MKNKILITAATGRTGYATTVNLLNEGYPVRIFVRSKNEKALELERLGAEVFVASLDNYQDLLDALQNVGNAYYCYPYKPGMPHDLRLFVDAAKATKMNAMVFMGQRTAEHADTGSALTNDTRQAYAILERSGLKVVYFVPGYFADIALVSIEYVLQLGIFPNPFGKGKNPWISTEDMGRCIAALLRNPEPYIGQKIFPTGPASIDAKEMAGMLEKVSGRSVLKVDIPEWLYYKAVTMEGKAFGFDAYAAVQSLYYNRFTRANRFDMEPNNIVKELTGREPESFETIARQHIERSIYSKRSIGSWLQAFLKFNKMPFVRVPGKEERMALNT